MNFSIHNAKALKQGLILVLLVLLAVLAFSVVAINRYLNSPLPESSFNTVFNIEPGSSFASLNTKLKNSGVIEQPRLFSLLARLRNVSGDIKTGEYLIEIDQTPKELLDQIVQGSNVQYRVTLVEGWTFRQALEAIQQSDKVEIEIENQSVSAILQHLDLEYQSMEGLMFPDTYFYTAGTSDLDIIERAHTKLNETLEASWNSKLGALPYANAYEALVMASIIEKESAASSERGHIAGVFIRRLELGMRLQSDPTVIYGMGERYNGNIRRADLREMTAYNTYRIDGLPPTPIALAGKESIEAALNPIPSDYLYFVSRGDGSHIFSTNLDEHNAAVNEYQRRIRTVTAEN